MNAGELVEAGRMHVAGGRTSEAVDCFARAAEDPEHGPEALSLLAAAYLLPGTLQPRLALLHAQQAARHPAAERDHLTRCAAVALWAGDPVFAEELTLRVRSADGDEAAAIQGTALAHRRDRGGLRRLLGQVDHASGPAAFWHRLVLESVALGWLREAFAARRLMRRGGMRVPNPAELAVRFLTPVELFTTLLAAILVALVAPTAVLAVPALGVVLGLSGAAAFVDVADGRPGTALAGVAWMVTAVLGFLLMRVSA